MLGRWHRTPCRAGALSCAAALLVWHSPGALGQGEGPRAFLLLPEGTQILSVYGVFGHTNESFDPGSVIAGAKVEVRMGALDYSRGFSLAGHAWALLATLPVGEADGSVTRPGVAVSNRSSGIGDLQLGAVFGLLGAPSMSQRDYDAYQPGRALGLLARVYAPTGEYDRSQLLNLGSNRWAGQLGLPFSCYLGSSFSDPALTTFEVLPSVTFYGANRQPYRAKETTQAPIVQLEGHITRNLNSRIWISLDGLFSYGGETTTDGVKDGNQQRAFGLGATASLALGSQAEVQLSYGVPVSTNNGGVNGHLVRLIALLTLD
jgi:hypothetical protein